MQVQLARGGNSLGVRIPKELAGRLGLKDGARVEIEAEGDRLVIRTDRPYYRLEELLTGITPEDMREAFDWGPDVGREVVD
ncbi:multidrug transporter MatE [Skermanella aerolata KACC 11604]|nr:multidrug transporter MatE [Skermanella aerolata KACC 11604]